MKANETLARGARQLVVQLALETMSISGLYSCSFTPTTNMGASLLGALMITFFAPPYDYEKQSYKDKIHGRKKKMIFSQSQNSKLKLVKSPQVNEYFA